MDFGQNRIGSGELWFGHGCSGLRVRSNMNIVMVWAWMLKRQSDLGTRMLFWFGHGCCGDRMLSEHEGHYASGMDAVVTVCSRNMNVIMVWAWMLG